MPKATDNYMILPDGTRKPAIRGGYYFSESGERAEAMLMMLESQIQKKIG